MSTLPPSLGIGHLALRCADLAVMERFYCDALGYRVVWRPDPDNCYLSSGRDNLALHAASMIAEGEGPLDHFGIVVAAAGDVDAWARHLESLDVVLEGPPRDHRDGTRSFYARDPEGNRVQFLHLGAGATP